jgi:hypothetical protein
MGDDVCVTDLANRLCKFGDIQVGIRHKEYRIQSLRRQKVVLGSVCPLASEGDPEPLGKDLSMSAGQVHF